MNYKRNRKVSERKKGGGQKILKILKAIKGRPGFPQRAHNKRFEFAITHSELNCRADLLFTVPNNSFEAQLFKDGQRCFVIQAIKLHT